MRLARHIRQIQAQGPVAALTSQNEAAKTLTTILRGDSETTQKSGSARTRRARGASLKDARGVVADALRLLTRIEHELGSATQQSYHARSAADALRRGRREIEERYAALIIHEAGGDGAPAAEILTAPEAINGGSDVHTR